MCLTFKLQDNKLHSNLPLDLLAAIEFAYEPNGFTCKNITQEAESQEYNAFVFELNTLKIKFRTGKITPTKIGQFVTLWKRSNNGIILPYDLNDEIDFFIVSVRKAEHFGQFVFPKQILAERGIVSSGEKEGKRAMRIYPPWDITESQQAKKTQAWQLMYFFEIPSFKCVDSNMVKKLLCR